MTRQRGSDSGSFERSHRTKGGVTTMRIDDFIRAVEGEPERAVTRALRAPSAQTLEVASMPGGMSLADFLSEPM